MPRRRNVRQGLDGCDLVCLGGAVGNGVGPIGFMRAIHGFALFSAIARSVGFMLRMKSSRYGSLSPPALAMRCQRAASTGSALMPRPAAYISASRFWPGALPFFAALRKYSAAAASFLATP